MSTFTSLIVICLFVCFIIDQQGCGAQKEECTRLIRVTKRVSRTFYYSCGWRGFWQCRGKRYYNTYTTIKKCCDGYEKVNNRCVRKLPMTTTPRLRTTTHIGYSRNLTTPKSPSAPVCGISMFDAKKLIVGGSTATKGEYPWLVSLVFTSHFCGGMIIDNRWILTAAHCVEFWKSIFRSFYHVRVGEYNRYAIDSKEVTMAIEKVITHENYSDLTVVDDIALIKTSKSIVFNEFVKPICLPRAKMRLSVNADVEIAGWGVTDPDNSGQASRLLIKAGMRLGDLSLCRKVYGSFRITSRVLCVTDGHNDMIKAACNGDSGGPLMLRENGMMYGIGITSYGAPSGCAGGDPVVYTDVTEYIDWINDQRAKN